MVHDPWLGPGREDRDGHPEHARDDAVAGGLGVVHPIQREDEQRRRDDGRELRDRLRHCFLNIFSMRSVIRNPLTMLVIDANSAMAPRMRIGSGWSAPTTTSEPT